MLPPAEPKTNENPFVMLPGMSQCNVSYVDVDGIKHTVEVDAGSLYEATVLGIVKFRLHGLEPAGLMVVQVEVINSIVHELTVKKLQDWLKRPGKAPKDIIEKERLLELLNT